VPAEEAIARVRARRPGSIETGQQLAAIHAYARLGSVSGLGDASDLPHQRAEEAGDAHARQDC
jgi:hypothetical protein